MLHTSTLKTLEPPTTNYINLPLLVGNFDSKESSLKNLLYDIKRCYTDKITAEPNIIGESSIFFSIQKHIDLLENYYIIDNYDEILMFLLTNDFLINILLEATQPIRKVFGESIKIHLNLHSDPEENYDELFIVIKNRFNPNKALKCMDELDLIWFDKIDNNTQGKLNIIEEPL